MLHYVLPVLLGYVLGSIPFGYVIVKLMRGIDIREYGSHNIGATNVLRVVGWFPALLTLLGDIGKGVLPPVFATWPLLAGPEIHPWVVVLAPLAAICGHAYSAFFYLKERKFARGKAVATGAGSVVGFVVTGQVHWAALAAVAGVWFAAIILPKLASGRWGWVSLASILAAITMPIAFALLHTPLPYIVFGVLAALFVTWKHKENLGRLADGVEPRLGEKVPLAGVDKDELSAAFMIHALTPEDWWQTRRLAWAEPLHRAGLLPSGVIAPLMKFIRPVKIDTIKGIRLPDGRNVQVHLITVPVLPETIKENPELAVRRCVQAAQVAKDLGARCLGLGSYWSVVGNKGADVQKAAPFITVTNGGAYTAGTVKHAVPMVLAKLRARGLEPEQATAAVVGANGVVGFGICRQLLPYVGRLIMIGTDRERLERFAARLRKRGEGIGPVIETSTDLADCLQAEMVFTATSTVPPVVFPEHIRPGAIVYDMGRPLDVDASVAEIPGVTVIPGGVVRPPGNMQGRVDVHFGEGAIPACMAETVLIAIDECYERHSVGDGTNSENIDYFVALAERLGFQVVGMEEPEDAPVEPVAASA